MHNSDETGETGDKAAHSLRGEGDFGDEDDGLAALRERLFDSAQVNFRFPGAGDAVQQKGRARILGRNYLNGGEDILPDGGLVCSEDGRQAGVVGQAGEGVTDGFLFAQKQQAALVKQLQVMEIAAAFGIDPIYRNLIRLAQQKLHYFTAARFGI